MVRGYYKGIAFYTDNNDLIHSRVTPVIGEEYYDIPTTLIYIWDGYAYRNQEFTTAYTYLDNGEIDTTKIYLARPGQRILGALNGIDETTCSLTRRLNDTDELTFTVNRIVDGQVSSFYDKIERHYELYIPTEGWFKIVDEPELSNDGNIETKSVVAESYEIELQQYDLIDFDINTGEVFSKEILATDNTYNLGGYSIPYDNVRFYRDTQALEQAIEEFKSTDGSVHALAEFATTHPAVFCSWRITQGSEGVEIDAKNESGGNYTGTEILDLELQRQHELSFLWLVLHEHNWGIGYIDPYVDLSSELEDDRIPLAQKVGRFEVDSQDIYSFLTQEAANFFRCIFVFDTKRRLVNAYNINNIGYDTNIFLSWHNIQNSVTRSGEEELYTVFRVSGDEDLKFTEANFGMDTIEDITYFLTTDHFSQEFIDKYNAWLESRENYRQQYIQLSKDYREKDAEVQELYTRVPTDTVDTSQYASFSEEELAEERSIQEALLAGYQSMYVDEDGNFDEEAILASPDAVDYLLLKDVILSTPFEALEAIKWIYDFETDKGRYGFDDSSYRLGNIDIAIFNKRYISGYYQVETDSPEIKQAKVSSTNAKDYVDSYMYDFDTYGSLYGLAELETRQTTLKNQYQTLASKGFNIDDPQNTYHHNQYLLYLKYLDGYRSCTRVLAERQEEYDTAMDELQAIVDDMDEIKQAVAKENNFTAEELELLDHYYIFTDYTNENILTTSDSTSEEIVDIEDQLYRDAADRLYAASHPQYSWSTTQDNLLLMPEFKSWHGQLNVGNFIRISMRDDWQVKLRISEITLNPLLIDPTIDLVFTTMTSYKSKRNDAVSILGNSGGGSSSKNSITSNYASHAGTADTVNVSTDLIMKILRHGSFTNYMNSQQNTLTGDTIQAVQGNIDNLVAQSMSAVTINVDQITGTTAQFQEVFSDYIGANYLATTVLQADTATIKNLQTGLVNAESVVSALVRANEGDFSSLTANTAFIEYLNSGVIEAGTVSADKVIAALVQAQSGDFDDLTANTAFIQYLNSGIITAGSIDVNGLKAKLATIDTLQANSAFVGYLQGLSSTVVTNTVTDQYVYNAVAGKISVGQLAAGDITISDSMRILSDNGNLIMNGSALQILGTDSQGNEYVGVQLGYATNGQPSLVLRNEDGATIVDPSGITSDAISDGLIVNDMIHTGTISEDKLGFQVMKSGDEISIEKIYTGDGKFGAEWTTFKQDTEGALQSMADDIANASVYQLYIEAPNGKNVRGGNITLNAKLFRNSVDVTNEWDASYFIWQRKSTDTYGDIYWNNAHQTGAKTITITGNDVNIEADFECRFEVNGITVASTGGE